jgi:TRAP-type C4-dicarboxylate transport system permease small subunit
LDVEKTMTKLLSVLDKVLTFFEEWTLFLTVLAAMVALFFNVILRYGFSYSLAWSEELVREVILYTTFIGCSVAIKNRSTVRIDALVQLVPKLKYPLAIFSYLVNLVFALMMVYFGYQLAALQVESGQSTLILQIPTVYLHAILPLMGVMMVIRVLMVMQDDIRSRRAAAQR